MRLFRKSMCRYYVKTNTFIQIIHTCIILYIIWVNYNISLTWIKAIWGWFPLLTMIIVRSQWGRYNLPRYYIYIDIHEYVWCCENDRCILSANKCTKWKVLYLIKTNSFYLAPSPLQKKKQFEQHENVCIYWHFCGHVFGHLSGCSCVFQSGTLLLAICYTLEQTTVLCWILELKFAICTVHYFFHGFTQFFRVHWFTQSFHRLFHSFH